MPRASRHEADASHPVMVLYEENYVILSVLNAIDKEGFHLFEGGELKLSYWLGVVDFLEGFAHGLHHAREEEVLLPALTEAGFRDEVNLFSTLRKDHRDGVSRLETLRRAVVEEDRDGVARAAGAYAFLFREHLQQETLGLYPVARVALVGSRSEALGRRLAGFVRDRFSAGEPLTLPDTARNLCRESRVDFKGMRRDSYPTDAA